ncbi:MAG TPA: MFS transporter [Tepidimicrobium sp.]|nr:MFS transporter [Tepidimicrobium sp.]
MTRKQKKLFAACYYAFFINGMTALIMGAVMPYILSDFNMGYDRGGMLLSFHSIGNLITSFAGGIISVYLGKRNAIVALSSMTALGFMGMIIFRSPMFLILPFFMTGIGRGSVTNISNTVVNDVSDGDTGALNILHIFFAIGAFIAPFIASWIFNMNLGWRYVIGLVATMASIMSILFANVGIDNTRKSKWKQEKKENISLDFLKDIDFYISSGILFFYIGVEYSVNGWIVTYLKDANIVSTSLAQRLLSMLWIIVIFGRLFSAYISKVVDKRTILLGSSIGTVVFFGLFMMSTSLWTIIGCILGLGFCLAGIYPTTVSNVGSVLKESQLAMGTLLAIAGLGGIVTPYIIGIVAEKRGIEKGMLVISVAITLLFLLSLVNRLRGSRANKFYDLST